MAQSSSRTTRPCPASHWPPSRWLYCYLLRVRRDGAVGRAGQAAPEKHHSVSSRGRRPDPVRPWIIVVRPVHSGLECLTGAPKLSVTDHNGNAAKRAAHSDAHHLWVATKAVYKCTSTSISLGQVTRIGKHSDRCLGAAQRCGRPDWRLPISDRAKTQGETDNRDNSRTQAVHSPVVRKPHAA
jgi:hypothetical protein